MHNWSVRTLFCALFLSCFSAVVAQGQAAYDPATLFPPADLKEDLHVLYETLTELDPALYRYRSKKQVDSMFNTLSAGIKKPMTEDAFKKDIVLPAVVFLQDLHFVVYPSLAAEAYLAEYGNYFPFDVRLVDGKLYIWRSYTAEHHIGSEYLTEIETINGINTRSIINKLKEYIVTDGASITAKKDRDIEESFRTYYGIVYGRPKEFDLGIKEYPAGKIRNVKVAAINWNAIEAAKALQSTRYEPPWITIQEETQTAVLKLHSFDPNTMGISDAALEKFIDSAFAAISAKEVKNLILDIRGNYGGRMNYGGKLYSYLTDSDFKYIERVEVRFPHMFPSIVHTSLGRSFLTNTYGMRFDTVVNGDSVYVWDTYQWTFAQKPAQKPFTGKLYVLTDGYTFSTTGLLASMIRAYKDNVVFVGEETGGAYEGCSGNLPSVTLPHTQLRVHFPIRKFVSPAKLRPERNKNSTTRGIIPDIPVSATIDQLMSGNDAVLKKALELAGKQ